MPVSEYRLVDLANTYGFVVAVCARQSWMATSVKNAAATTATDASGTVMGNNTIVQLKIVSPNIF